MLIVWVGVLLFRPKVVRHSIYLVAFVEKYISICGALQGPGVLFFAGRVFHGVFR